METAETKSLAQMCAEVDEYCQDKGWREKTVTFGEAMALLHEEIGEAGSAWRKWGLEDATAGDIIYHGQALTPAHPKPEGVGSEFADVFIRLLDDSIIFGVDLEAMATRGRFGISDSFLTNMDTLHVMVAKASMAHQSDDWADEEGTRGGWTWRNQFGDVLVFLRQLCDHYGIDLLAEYERKMAYNRVRPYKHGGKRR